MKARKSTHFGCALLFLTAVPTGLLGRARSGGKTVQAITLSTQQFAAIDISGNSVTAPVSTVALDENGNAAFATAVDDGATGQTVTTKTFIAGQVADAGHFYTVYSLDQGWSWNYLTPRYLRPNGKWLGGMDVEGFSPGTDDNGDEIPPATTDPGSDSNFEYYLYSYYFTFRGGFIASGSQVGKIESSPFADVSDGIHPNDWHRKLGSFFAGSDAGYCTYGTYTELVVPGQPTFTVGSTHYAGFENGSRAAAQIISKNGAFFFEPLVPSNIPDTPNPPPPAAPSGTKFRRQVLLPTSYGSPNVSTELNDSGAIISGWGDQWWNGQEMLSTNLPSTTTAFWGLTNENRMVGELDSDPMKGFLWESGTRTLLSDILSGTTLAGQITHIVPLLISNEDQTTHVYRMLTAVQEANRDELVLWTSYQTPGTSSRHWELSRMEFPQGVDIQWDHLEVISSSGIIAAIGNPGPTSATPGADHALLLVPIGLRLLNGKTTDFDGKVVKRIIPKYINNAIENPLYDQQVKSNGPTSKGKVDDTLGAKPLGEGRISGDPRKYYAYDMMAAAKAPAIPWLHYRWMRYIQLFGWNIRKKSMDSVWYVSKRRDRDWEDDNASNNCNNEPSINKNEFYVYDNSCLEYHPDMPASEHPDDDSASSIGDYAYVEKVFKYVVEYSLDKPSWTEMNAEWHEGPSFFALQKALARLIAHTFDIRTSWSAKYHYFDEGYMYPSIDAEKVREIVGGSLPITFDPACNIHGGVP